MELSSKKVSAMNAKESVERHHSKHLEQGQRTKIKTFAK